MFRDWEKNRMAERNGKNVSLPLFIAAITLVLAALGYLWANTVSAAQFRMVCERLDRMEAQSDKRFDRVDDRLNRILERR
jgi:hypothetical protein